MSTIVDIIKNKWYNILTRGIIMNTNNNTAYKYYKFSLILITVITILFLINISFFIFITKPFNIELLYFYLILLL